MTRELPSSLCAMFIILLLSSFFFSKPNEKISCGHSVFGSPQPGDLEGAQRLGERVLLRPPLLVLRPHFPEKPLPGLAGLAGRQRQPQEVRGDHRLPPRSPTPSGRIPSTSALRPGWDGVQSPAPPLFSSELHVLPPLSPFPLRPGWKSGSGGSLAGLIRCTSAPAQAWTSWQRYNFNCRINNSCFSVAVIFKIKLMFLHF